MDDKLFLKALQKFRQSKFSEMKFVEDRQDVIWTIMDLAGKPSKTEQFEKNMESVLSGIFGGLIDSEEINPEIGEIMLAIYKAGRIDSE